jgi:hypothetical protein
LAPKKVPQLEPAKRPLGFHEVSLGYSREQAPEEAKRCLRCDLRLQISPPVLPPEKWIEFSEQNLDALPEIEGVLQLVDSEKNTIYIKGTLNLREELKELLKEFRIISLPGHSRRIAYKTFPF